MGEEKRIIGPPGCGKTTAVASEVSHAVALGKSVMLASLTKASAAELGGRMMPIAKRRIGTLHSHCYWALSYPELAESHIDQWNEEHPGQQLNLNNDLDDVTSSGSDYAFAQYQLYRARMESIPEHRTHIRSLAADWEKWKEQYGYLDFTDLIETCLYDVDHAPENPDVICIDEAQDHSALEMALVRKWGEQARELIVVGDPLQAIFDWRGADPEVFYTPEIDNQIILDQSYRVPRAVHTKAMSWIEGMPGYRPILYHPTEVEGEVRRMGGSWKGADQALSIVRPYLEQGKSVMFLTTCGYMLGPLIKTLREQGIPYHNPYRPQSGQWNPLSTRRGATSAAERLAAFLKPSMGQQWTIEDVKCWSDICAAKTLAVKKEALDSFDAGVPLPNMMLGVLLDDEGVEAAVHGDLNWYREHLLASRKKTMEFPMQVYRRNGPEKLVHPPQITVGTIHCSPPDEPVLTTRGYKEIGELDPNTDRLVSYNGSRIVRGPTNNGQGYEFQIARNPYVGQLVNITTEESFTRVTPDHRVRVRYSDAFYNKWIVYLMRRGAWWRIGIATSASKPYKSGGLGSRLATEQADAGWILSVCHTREEALFAESSYQCIYGIPGLTFESQRRTGGLVGDRLHMVHDLASDRVSERVANLFEDTGLKSDQPLYVRIPNERSDGAMHGYAFQTIAANLLSSYMEIPTENGWQNLQVSHEWYEGDVYSLEVLPHHYYISGGAVVHNSVKGGEADVVYMWPDLSRQGYDQWMVDRAPIYRLMYVAMTRAKETLIIGGGNASC